MRVKFWAGLDGQGETTEIFTRNIPDLGFKEAAGEAVKKMKFAPIYRQGRNIKVYFQKNYCVSALHFRRAASFI